MDTLKQVWLRFLDLLKQMASSACSIADAIKHWKLRAIANLLEAERLDRIRNSSKYLGK